MATVTDSDSCHGSEGFAKLVAGAPGGGSVVVQVQHPQAVVPPAPTGPRTHGPKLKTALQEGPQGFRRVTHAH